MMHEEKKEPSQQEIYDAVYEVIDSIEKKKEEVLKLFFEINNLPLDRDTISRLKQKQFQDNPDYSEIWFDGERVITFQVSYKDSVPLLEVQATGDLQKHLEEIAKNAGNRQF